MLRLSAARAVVWYLSVWLTAGLAVTFMYSVKTAADTAIVTKECE